MAKLMHKKFWRAAKEAMPRDPDTGLPHVNLWFRFRDEWLYVFSHDAAHPVVREYVILTEGAWNAARLPTTPPLPPGRSFDYHEAFPNLVPFDEWPEKELRPRGKYDGAIGFGYRDTICPVECC